MKKIGILVLTLLCFLLNTSSTVFAQDKHDIKEETKAKYQELYDDLYQMISSQDSSYYFGTLEMTIGSEYYSLDGEEHRINPITLPKEDSNVLGFQILAEVSGSALNYDPVNNCIRIKSRYSNEIQYVIDSNSLSINGTKYEIENSEDRKEELIEKYFPVVRYEYISDNNAVWMYGRNRIA